MTGLVEIIERLDDALGAAGIPHAFGGALALAYGVWEPRATADVDLNVFVPNTEARRAFDALPGIVTWSAEDLALVARDGQCRCWAERTPVDLFFDTTEFHVQAAGNTLTVPFGDRTIPVLAPDDLAVFKAFFDRPKDWVDLQAMADARSFDATVVIGWLRRLLGDDDPRIANLQATVARAAPPTDDDVVVFNVPAGALAGRTEPCGHPTATGPCRNLVRAGRRCAAGHPPRS